MRFAVLSLAALVIAGALFLLSGGSKDFANGQSPIGQASGTETANPRATAEQDDRDGPSELPSPFPKEPAAPELQGRRRAPITAFTGDDLVEFSGTALLQPKNQRPYAAVRGTLHFEVMHNGWMIPVSAEVNEGRFSVRLPNQSPVRIMDGRLEDQKVRFPVNAFFGDVFTLDASTEYAFVGEPVPEQRLRVLDGTSGTPLTGVTVRTAADGVTALMENAAAEGEAIVTDAASPIELPYLEATRQVWRPVWLHVSAENYSTTALLVDLRQPAELEVVLWPAASLTVRVTGPQRSRLNALIIHQLEPSTEGKEPRKRHIATVDRNAPGRTADTEATIFALKDLPALPLTIEARGFDKRGREALLGTTSIELEPNQAGRVEIRVEKL